MAIDYARAAREHRANKSALTRARNSGDPDRVVAACRKAVRSWESVGAWPDQWSDWQRALDDALGWTSVVRLEDLI
jgi:hypothetical protein